MTIAADHVAREQRNGPSEDALAAIRLMAIAAARRDHEAELARRATREARETPR